MITYTKLLFSDEVVCMAMALVLSLIFSTAVYHFVENPIRKIKSPKLSIALLVMVVWYFAAGRVSHMHPDILPNSPLQRIAEINDRQNDTYFPGKLKRVEKEGVAYWTNDAERDPVLLFIGDSHLHHLHARLEKAGTGIPYAVISNPGCLIAPNVASYTSESCTKANKDYLKILETPSIKRVVQSQRWGIYNTDDIDDNGANNLFIDELDNRLELRNKEGFEKVMKAQKSLMERHQKEYWIVLDNPWDNGIDRIAPVNERLRFALGLSTDKDTFELNSNGYWSAGNRAVEAVLGSDVEYVDLTNAICPEGKCQVAFYRDGNHLAASMVREKLKVIDTVFEGF